MFDIKKEYLKNISQTIAKKYRKFKKEKKVTETVKNRSDFK